MNAPDPRPVYEVFSPVDGHAIYTTHSESVAAIVAGAPGLDYARKGEGWAR